MSWAGQREGRNAASRVDAEKAVIYRSRMNPFLGRSFEAMDPLEWLARLSDHIPDPGQHRHHGVACPQGGRDEGSQQAGYGHASDALGALMARAPRPTGAVAD